MQGERLRWPFNTADEGCVQTALVRSRMRSSRTENAVSAFGRVASASSFAHTVMLSVARRSTRTARPLLSLARANHTLPPNNGPSESSTTHFGFRSVPTPEKQSLVHNVFSSVASSYDLMNDAMSLGVHRLWKDDYVSLLRPGSKGPMKCIDVAGGTGDIALRILDWSREKYGERGTSVDVVDINGGMLAEGQKRFAKTMYHATPQVSFTEADAQALNRERFPDNTYDLYTIAFGIRNVTDINAALREAQRVLKPGGVFACLEFNKVNNPLLAQ